MSTLEVQAYRDCYAACRAAGGDEVTCQQQCDPAFTGWEVGPYGISEPRFEGPALGEAFIGGVGETVQTITGAIYRYLPESFGEFSGLVKWLVVGAGILLVYKVLR